LDPRFALRRKGEQLAPAVAALCGTKSAAARVSLALLQALAGEDLAVDAGEQLREVLAGDGRGRRGRQLLRHTRPGK